MRNVEEFCLVWMESAQQWFVVMDNGSVLQDRFGSVGLAQKAALSALGRFECEFYVSDDGGDFYRFQRDDDHWGASDADRLPGLPVWRRAGWQALSDGLRSIMGRAPNAAPAFRPYQIMARLDGGALGTADANPPVAATLADRLGALEGRPMNAATLMRVTDLHTEISLAVMAAGSATDEQTESLAILAGILDQFHNARGAQ